MQSAWPGIAGFQGLDELLAVAAYPQAEGASVQLVVGRVEVGRAQTFPIG
jgi:hypothetical protein